MGFAGSVMAMMQSLKANARPKHSAYKDWKKTDAQRFSKNRTLIDKTVSKEELLLIKEKNRRIIEKEKRKQTIIISSVIAVSLPIAFLLIFKFFFTILPNDVKNNTTTVEVHPKKTLPPEQIEYLLNSGYEWLGKMHYNNARFQFNRVLEVQPNNKIANYGLTASYVYECDQKNINCDKAQEMLTNYISKYGEDNTIVILKEILNEHEIIDE